jgi:PEP-CTERM motif
MKNSIKCLLSVLLPGVILAAFPLGSQATVSFYDDFNSYANGNLAGTAQDALGQGTWRQTSTANATPVQVNNGTVVLGTSGQDVYAPLTSPISITDGSTFYIGATVDLTAAQATGDYFLHFTPTVGNSSIFPERLYAKSSGAGFVFGYDGASGGTVNYSSTVLNLNTSYRIVLAYTGVNGTLNDTFALYVNPTDTSVEGNNSAYLTSGYVGTGAESTTVAAINLRQGSAANAPSVILDNLTVATLFSDAAPVPEPSTIAFFVMGGFASLVALRRKR